MAKTAAKKSSGSARKRSSSRAAATPPRKEDPAVKAAEEKRAEAGVATPADNAELDHSRGGTTTRDDRHDVGVPMLEGDPREPAGPEDALGVGEKRGDYRDRVPGQPHTAVPLEGAGEVVRRFVDRNSGAAAKEGDKDAVQVVTDMRPTSTVVPQKPRTEDIGNSNPILKGGVTTDPAALGTLLGVAAAGVAEGDAR